MDIPRKFHHLPIHELFFLENQLQILAQVGFRIGSGWMTFIEGIWVFAHVNLCLLLENFR